MNKRGFLIIVSGPSAVGKGTVVKRAMDLAEERGLPIVLSISMTSRDARLNEQDGVDYFFVSRDEFENAVKNNGLVEYNEYNGNYYGTKRAFVEQCLDEGKSVILEIDVNGGRQVVEQYPNAVTIFIMPPSLKDLENRIRLRNRENEEEIVARLAVGRGEISGCGWYDYIVVNDIIEEAAESLLSIIEAEKHKGTRNANIINEVLNPEA